MTGTLLDPGSVDRLAKIAGLFGSEHAGERAEAAAKADALVRGLGLTWHDVISVQVERQDVTSARPDWRQMARTCWAHAYSLNPREADFISNMVRQQRRATDKQLAWLTDIYERVAEATAQQRENR